MTTPADSASMRDALHAEADDLETSGGMVSAHWVASHLRFIAEHGRRWPQPGEGVHISRGRTR